MSTGATGTGPMHTGSFDSASLGMTASVGSAGLGSSGLGFFGSLGAMTSRAECAYCGAHARPNAMYCMSCGQIVVAPRVASSHPAMHAAAAAAAAAIAGSGFPGAPGGVGAGIGSGLIAPAPPSSPRPAMEQYLLPPVPALPALAQAAPGAADSAVPAQQESQGVHAAGSTPAAPAAPPLVAPPLPRLASTDARLIELALASGERIKIDGTAVLGRRPEATARNSGAQAVVVPDDTMSVSRAHAIIEVQGDTVIVSDAGSANGSAVERDGATLPLRSGRQIVLEHGDRIWLGSVWVDVTLAGANREGVR